MLILTRKVGDSIMIGDEIKVKIMGVDGNQVRVGTHAPRSVAVHRKEIYQRIQQGERREMEEKPKPLAESNPVADPAKDGD